MRVSERCWNQGAYIVERCVNPNEPNILIALSNVCVLSELGVVHAGRDPIHFHADGAVFLARQGDELEGGRSKTKIQTINPKR